MSKFFTTMIACLGLAFAAQTNVSVTVQPKWGYDSAYAVTNGLVQLTLIPGVGGRPMEYNLGTHAFLHTDSASLATPPVTDTPYSAWGGGGFLTWPTPQASWPGTWPPPVFINQGRYTSRIVSSTADSIAVEMTSPLETDTIAKGLVCRKTFTTYSGTSRIRVDARMINKGSATQTWSIREIAQCFAEHDTTLDWSSMWAFFPKGTSTLDSARGFWLINDMTDLTEFHTDYSPGTVAMQYNGMGGQVGAQPTRQWIAFQDSVEGYTLVHKGAYQPDGTYPEYGGAVVVLWMGSWIEAELCSPQKSIAPNDSVEFITDLYATKLAGAVADVNNAGVINTRIAVNASTGTVTGQYGVFTAGQVKLWFAGQSLATAQYDVTPLNTFTLNASVSVPVGGQPRASLLLYNASGAFVDTLDSGTYTPAGTIMAMRTAGHFPGYCLNGRVLTLTNIGRGYLTVTAIDGRLVRRTEIGGAGTEKIDLSMLSHGMYLLSIAAGSAPITGKIMIR